jgi:hypothetical protein
LNSSCIFLFNTAHSRDALSVLRESDAVSQTVVQS